MCGLFRLIPSDPRSCDMLHRCINASLEFVSELLLGSSHIIQTAYYFRQLRLNSNRKGSACMK